MSKILIQKNGAIGTVIISNPTKFNAMTLAMWQRLPAALKELDEDPEIRVMIVKGEGERAFISGADISEFDALRDVQEAQDSFDLAVSNAYQAPSLCRKPVIALIRGICFGGGLGFAAACDVRLCAADARFRMPAARLGLGYDPEGIKRFMDVMGYANTADICYSARVFQAEQALQMGFVSQVFDVQEYEQATQAYVNLVAQNAPLTIAAAKLSMTQYLKPESRRDFDTVKNLVAQCYTSADYAEGRIAFAEKRAPVFQSK